MNIVDPAGTAGSSFFPSTTLRTIQRDLLTRSIPRPPIPCDRGSYYHDANTISIYSDPRTGYTWPLTYGTTFTDSLVCDEPGSFPRTRYGESTVACVRYGTLVLPYGSFADRLLLHRHWNYCDDYAEIAPGYVEGDAYSFVRAGLHVPLLSMSYSTYTQGDSGIVNQGTTLLSETSTGVVRPSMGRDVHRALLGQRSGELTVLWVTTGPAQVEVVTAEGRCIAALTFATGSTKLRCSLAQAPAGL